MKTSLRRKHHRGDEAGQAMMLYLLVLGTFLLGVLCFAFDLSNMWFHRQMAQTAADAACAAGAMDLLVDAQSAATGHQGFVPGTAYNCSTSSTDSVCSYAAKNGYNSNNANPGNLVSVSFPGSVIGITTPPAAIASHAFIRVDIIDRVPRYFARLLSPGNTSPVRAFSTCGIELAAAPIPLLVLDPINPGKTSALSVQGTPSITIWGGPQQSIQVNSGNPAAVNIGGSATIDLHLGGPSNTGSDLGTWGGPATAPGGFIPGSTGHWQAPHAPINDPFAQISDPVSNGAITSTAYGWKTNPAPLTKLVGQDGCPDSSGCYEYLPGNYTAGICIGKSCKTFKALTTAIFQGGIYVVNGFSADSNSCIRPSFVDAMGMGGTMLYITGGGAVNVDANSGSKCPAAFDTFNANGNYSLMLANGIKCTATSTVPNNLKPIASLTGNVLLAPCTGSSALTKIYGDPYEAIGQVDPLGEQRGFLFFQDRSTQAANQSWGGGGSFLLAGTMYFHACNAAATGTGCGATPTWFSDQFTLQGNPGSTTYMLGDIVADNIILGGNSGITMDLNTTVAFNILKASILQ
ncbi:MAG TPA: pilus assembly protein TadG-related protein [Candidatus Sulfotelmatobacter sp.]|nr:pilus assembly protein TadG-related protein [Candidatus Sulfotelmatobacter sp.]